MKAVRALIADQNGKVAAEANQYVPEGMELEQILEKNSDHVEAHLFNGWRGLVQVEVLFNGETVGA